MTTRSLHGNMVALESLHQEGVELPAAVIGPLEQRYLAAGPAGHEHNKGSGYPRHPYYRLARRNDEE